MLGETSFSGSSSMMRPTHYVSPHWVNSYVRRDGTVVRGHWRDGDGNPFVDRSFGYFARNPLRSGGSPGKRSVRRTYTVNGLTFHTGPSALETGLSTLFWGTVGTAFAAMEIDGICKNIQKSWEEYKARGTL